MTGQERIVALRRNGRSPRVVWVNDFACTANDGATVSVSPGDTPERLDWRFLVGLTAIVSSLSTERLGRIEAACRPIAKRVIGNLHGVGVDSLGRPCFPVLKITDTEGVLTWQK